MPKGIYLILNLYRVIYEVTTTVVKVIEKDLTLKFEYHGRTLFSEDYVINVQSSLIYISVVSSPFVIIILFFVLTYVRRNRKK